LKTLAILPVKNLSESKSRLSTEMNREQRESLTAYLLKRTLDILKSVNGIDDILLVSRDEKVNSIAKREKTRFLSEQGTGLNQALEQATDWAVEQDYSAILILPTDLPFLTEEDIEAIIGIGEATGQIAVIAPDRDMKGTNALMIKPPGILKYQFGPDSFRRHCQLVSDRHIDSRIYRSMGTGFDLDSPSQYHSILQANLPEFNLCQKP